MKRAFDLTLSLLLLPLAIPLVLVCALAVRLESRGPAILAQPRLGRNQDVFRCYKIRTMKRGTADAASHVVGASSITRVGRVLRAAKLDELPQILNVLRGEMSFVGPRPGLPVQHDLTRARAAEDVFRAVPGVTGLAQVQGVDMSDPVRLAKLDRCYVEERSMWLDLKLILLTLAGSGRGDAARPVRERPQP